MSSFRYRLKSASPPRWLGVFLALAVFFLPLHFHVTLANSSQITKECGCLHGTRTQLAMTAVAARPALPIELAAIDIDKESPSSKIWYDSQKVRGPPSLTAL